jgi:hypothetical protein
MYTRAVALAALFVAASLSVALPQDTPKITTLPEVVVSAPSQRVVPRRRAPSRAALTRGARVAAARTPPTVTSAGRGTAPGPNTSAGPGGIGSAPGQTLTAINRDQFDDRRTFTIGSVLEDSPGIDIKQGNGPRDKLVAGHCTRSWIARGPRLSQRSRGLRIRPKLQGCATSGGRSIEMPGFVRLPRG